MSQKKCIDTTHNGMLTSKIHFTPLLQQITCPWRKFSQNTSKSIKKKLWPDTSIYDGEGSRTPFHGYKLIDPLKNLRSTPVLRTKELSLVILRITKLRM